MCEMWRKRSAARNLVGWACSMDVMDRGIGNEDVVSADVEEGILNPITNQLSHQSQEKSDTYLRQFLFSPVVVVVELTALL